MDYRHSLLKEDQDYTTADTDTHEVKFKEPCTALDLLVKYKNAVTMVETDGHPHAIFSKIELVDGSDVLISLSGKQLAAQYFYDTMKVPYGINSGEGNTTQKYMLRLMFGREMWDPLYAFDPMKFDNPQIKLSYNKALYDSDIQEGTYSLFAHLFDEKVVSPTGIIMRKEVKSWPPTASQREYTDLPTDYPYRQMFIQGYASTKEIRTVVDKFKLSEDQDKRIPINDLAMYDWIGIVHQKWPEIKERVEAYVGGEGVIIYVAPTYTMKAVLMQTSTGSVFDSETEGDKLKIETSAVGTGGQIGYAFGWVYHHTVPVLLGNMMDPADAYDVTRIGKLELQTLAKSDAEAAHTGAVTLEQYRPY